MKWWNSFKERLIKLKHKLAPNPRAPNYPDGFETLARWQYSQLGKEFLAEQQVHIDHAVQDVFGYHFLEMSAFDVRNLGTNSPINHRFHLTLTRSEEPLLSTSGAVSHFESLPLEDESIDVVLLHHALEYSHWPHQILRESARVIIPRGHIIICGFNPWSLQGLVQFFTRWFSKNVFWQRSNLRKSRVVDWLRLLDCEPVACYRGFYRPPINNKRILKQSTFLDRVCRRLHLPLAGYYVLVARKDTLGVTPLKPRWLKIRQVPGLSVSRPATRVSDVTRTTEN